MSDLYDLSDEELEAQVKAIKAGEVEIDDPAEEQIEDDFVDPIEESTELEEDTESEEDFDDDLEQPEEDSGHDSDVEDEEESEEEEDSEANSEVNPEEEPAEESEDATSDTPETKSDISSTEVKKVKVKANGREFEFDEKEIMEQFPKIFGQAMDYTKKLQAIKPWRKTIDAIEQAQLKQDDINLMIDVLKGDKDAISEVLKRTGVNAFDLNPEEAQYTPNDYGRDEHALELDDVVKEISQDPEFAITQNVLTQQWDDASVEALTQQPDLIKLLHTDIRDGIFDKIAPIANKFKVYDGAKKSDLDYYGEASRQYFRELSSKGAVQSAPQQQQQPAEPAKDERVVQAKQAAKARNKTKAASAKRKAAAPTRSKAGESKAIDYLDDSDEAFEEWYQKVMDV